MSATALIVDDDATLRRALGQRLAHWGYEVREAASGAEAIEVSRRTEHDLVLLDLSMPGLSGLDVLRALRGEGIASDVIVLTARPCRPPWRPCGSARPTSCRSPPTSRCSAPSSTGAPGGADASASSALEDRAEAAVGPVPGASPRMARLPEVAARAAATRRSSGRRERQREAGARRDGAPGQSAPGRPVRA